MKKVYVMTLTICIMILSSCSTTGDNYEVDRPQTLKEAVSTYKEKLEYILEDDATTLASRNNKYYNDTPYDPDDMLEKQVYMDVYNEQVDRSFEVHLTDYLSIYKTMLADIDQVLNDYEIEEIEVEMEIKYDMNEGLTAQVSFSKDFGVVIKFQMPSIFGNGIYEYAIKTGYEGDVFFVKELKSRQDSNHFDYFEFRENHSLIDISYTDEKSYHYSYVNQVDETTFDLYISENSYGPDAYRLLWYNPETRIMTIYGNGYEPIKYFALYNDKGMVFNYTDYLDETISLWFQLLEATGWDHAYLDSNAHRQQGVYKDGQMLFEEEEYRQFNVDLYPAYNIANVSVTIDLAKSDLTNEILNLNAYDMTFNYSEITIDYINQTVDRSYDESKELAIYRGIDFYGANIYDQFIDVIDSDLLFLE